MTQAATPQPAITPPPAPSPLPGQRLTVVQNAGAGSPVYTARDVAVLKARRTELSNQLTSADGRRRSLQKSLQGATGADKAGLEQRLGVLDTRIARLETDIEENGRALASPSAASVRAEQPFAWNPASGNRVAANATPLMLVFMIFVLSPIAIGIGRTRWKRASRPQPTISPETAQRLERMEQAIDSIAVEMERVSEGQRFVTRILSERRGEPALGGGEQDMLPMRLGASEGPSSAR